MSKCISHLHDAAILIYLEGAQCTGEREAPPPASYLEHEHVVHQHLHAFLEVLSPLPKAGQVGGLLRARKCLQLPQQAPLRRPPQCELLS